MLYWKIVKGISGYISRELRLTDKERDRIRFALEVLISTSITLSLSLFLAVVLGIFKYVVLVMSTGALLKLTAGGIHLKSPWECAVSTALITNILGLISSRLSHFFLKNWFIITATSFLLIMCSLILWSPAEVPEKPIKKESKRKILKTISIVFSLSSAMLIFYLLSVGGSKYAAVCCSILAGLLFQSFTICPTAYKLHNMYYTLKHKDKSYTLQ